MHLSVSMPYLFTDIFLPGSLKGKLEQSFLEKHLKEGKKLKSPIRGIELYATKEGSDFVFFGVQGNQVVYYMKTGRKSLIWEVDHPLKKFKRAIYQSEVWRHNKLQWPANTITTQVFSRYLSSPSRLLISDRLQSESGRMFWVRQITQTLAAGGKAWVLASDDNEGQRLTIRKAAPVLMPHQIDQYYTTGSDYLGARLRLAITGVL